VLASHTIAENAGPAATTGTITRNNMDTSQALTVNLTSSNTSQAAVPASVTIPAGAASATFNVDAVDNQIVDPTQTVVITATAASSLPAGLDSTFGSGGFASVALNYSNSANFPDVKVQPDGKIVAVAGSQTSGATWAVTRTNSDGTPDTSFGNNGTVVTTFPASTGGYANGVAFQPDGKIIVVGTVNTSTSNYDAWGIARYNADGTPDTTFGTNGLLTVQFTGEAGWLYDAAVLPDGKILVGGMLQQPGGFAVARLTSTGQIDTSFGSGGFASVNPDPTHNWFNTTGQAMIVQPDGKILMTGIANYNYLPVVRFNANGTPDTTFNGTGTQLIPLSAFGSTYATVQGYGLALQSDGKILVVGSAAPSSAFNSDWVAARLNPDGTLDTSFGSNGVDTLDFAGGSDQAYDVVVQADGKILVGGQEVVPGTGFFLALARFNTDGTLDQTFNGTGEMTTKPPSVFESIWGMDLQTDGKLATIAGYTNSMHIVRYDTGLLAASDSLNVTDTDGAPKANAGGPYTVPEGGTVQLDASATTDTAQDPSTLTYTWDLNGDQIYGETGAAATRGDEVGISPTFSAAGLNGPGSYVVHLKVTDARGLTSFAEATINITNVAPTATLSNSGPVDENSPVTVRFTNQLDPSSSDTQAGFHYSFATDPSQLATSYAGATDGASQTFTFPDGPATPVVYGRIFDKDGGFTDYQTAVTVNDVAPTASVSGPTATVQGQAQTFTFTAGDVSPIDQAAGFSYTIDWGDNSTTSVTGGGSVMLSHVFTAAGTNTIQVWATDKDGKQSSAPGALPVTVLVAALENNGQGNDLVVGGTTGNDTIVLKPADTAGNILVTVNGAQLGSFHPTGRILIYAQAGDDNVQLQSAKIGRATVSITVPAFIFGGDGNDTINAVGSSANNVLVGGSGADTLTGGSGRNILIGGGGADVLHGGSGGDILIGGMTDYDTNLADLALLISEWGRTDLSYQQRIDHLLGSASGGRNGSTYLNAQTVHDDGAVDQLFGQGGSDWFFARTSGSLQDSVNDRRHGEVVTPIT
jgi:uncharacterized delta-60 repeat protein